MNTLIVSREYLLNALPMEYRDQVVEMLNNGAKGTIKLGSLTLKAEGVTVVFANVDLVFGQQQPAKRGGAR